MARSMPAPSPMNLHELTGHEYSNMNLNLSSGSLSHPSSTDAFLQVPCSMSHSLPELLKTKQVPGQLWPCRWLWTINVLVFGWVCCWVLWPGLLRNQSPCPPPEAIVRAASLVLKAFRLFRPKAWSSSSFSQWR
jgi:hypothetical protein